MNVCFVYDIMQNDSKPKGIHWNNTYQHEWDGMSSMVIKRTMGS